jgi:hypothetical protein
MLNKDFTPIFCFNWLNWTISQPLQEEMTKLIITTLLTTVQYLVFKKIQDYKKNKKNGTNTN